MFDDEQLNAFAQAFGEEIPEGPKGHGVKLNIKWRPKLNPTQERVARCQAEYILAYGERGTGKTIGALHKIVEHCVNERNAFALIIVKEVGQATEGGAWHKLITDILPQWKNGNFDRKTGKRIDTGCGIEYTDVKLDPLDKKPYIWVSNKFGGWSQIKLISLFVGGHVEAKVKGKEPSAALVDEAQTTDDPSYFNDLIQQIGRRQDIVGQQFIIYCCNPKGTSHWLYERFFIHEFDENDNPIEYAIDEKTGFRIDRAGNVDERYAIFHVPIAENQHNLPKGYWDRVLEAVKNDPIEYDRMVLGLWADKPEGDAIFGEHWKDAQHLRGDLSKAKGLIPAEGYPLVMSWDPGAAHTSVHFMQLIATVDKLVWAVIDEKNCVGSYMPYRRLVPEVIKRMQYWEEEASRAAGKKIEFRFIHVSDDSAFNQFRAKEGSFDAQDIEDISKAHVEQLKLKAPAEEREGLDRFIIRMKAAPKGQHSVEARVRLTTDLLVESSLVVSAICIHTRDMFMKLEMDKDNRMKPKRSRHLHPFDSLSYGFIYFNSGGGRSIAKAQLEPRVKTEFFKVGK